MFSFRRLRHIDENPVCINRIEGLRLLQNAEQPAGRICREPAIAANTVWVALAAAAALLIPAVALRAQDPGNSPQDSAPAPAQVAGQSDSNPAPTGQDQAGQDQASQDQTGQDQASQDQTGQDQAGQAAQETPGQISVQERIRQRRAQRRATAIHDAYDHLFESYAGMGYLRFQPGASLQRTTFYGWNTGLTRYYSERFGVDVDARGYYGIAYTGLQFPGSSTSGTNATDTRPKISEYNVLLGPTYRFYIQPKFSISGRVLGGFALGNFSGDTNGFGSTSFGIWPDGITYAGAGSLIGQFNISPGISFRLTGEDFVTGFGSTTQNSFGFTGGFVYRFGRQ
jgi:hypothetical protein